MKENTFKPIPSVDFFLLNLGKTNELFYEIYGHPYELLKSAGHTIGVSLFYDYENEYIPFLTKKLNLDGFCYDSINNLLAANRKKQKEQLKIADTFGFRILMAVDSFLSKFTTLYAKRMKRGEIGEMFSIIDQMVYAFYILKESEKHLKYEYLSRPYFLLKITEFSILKERQKFLAEEEERQRRLREEQRALKELKREKEQAEKDAAKAQAAIEKNEVALANAKTSAQIKKLQQQIEELKVALQHAEERRDRAISMAQQTRCGYVYIISNIGSFGEGVYKIGMTRRIDPMQRVRELGDASVPFPFDVHAMIYTEDAPGLESHLHRVFDLQKVNTVNWRKEYFRVPLEDIRNEVEKSGINCEWVLSPEAAQYKNSEWHRRIGNMDATELEEYRRLHPEEFPYSNSMFNYNPFEDLEEE